MAKDLQGNEVSPAEKKKYTSVLLAAGALILIALLVSYRVSDCTEFNRLNRQRLRNLENFGAAATLRENQRDWKYPWLVKDTSPVKLVFFDHPRFGDKPLTEKNINFITRLIGGLPEVESVHIARKRMSDEVIKQLEDRLDHIEFTVEDSPNR